MLMERSQVRALPFTHKVDVAQLVERFYSFANALPASILCGESNDEGYHGVVGSIPTTSHKHLGRVAQWLEHMNKLLR